MISNGVRRWLVNLSAAVAFIGMLVFIINSGGLWHRDLAVVLGFGEYNGVIMWTSVTLCVAGVIVFSVLHTDDET